MHRPRLSPALAWFTAVVLATLAPAVGEALMPPPQGFGASTRGGTDGAVIHVTNLHDSGAGSLRSALSQGNRTIVFDVAGEIALATFLYVLGANITIDGFSAPGHGITLTGYGLIIRGDKGAHDVIVRGIRVRSAAIDGIQVASAAFNVLIDHVSVAGAIDGNIDITDGAHDVTVSWSILGANAKNMLVKYNTSKVTLHHNVFTASTTRGPQIRIDDTTAAVATATTADIRNNLVANWGVGYGTMVWYGPWANVVNNYYTAVADALTIKRARAYVAGNFTPGQPLRTKGTEVAPFDAPAVDTQDACTAATLALASAGVRPLDTTDDHLLSAIAPPACGGAPVLAPLPSLLFQAIADGANPPTQSVTVAEADGRRVAWTAVASTPWLTVNPGKGTAPTSLRLSAHVTGLAAGTHAATVIVQPKSGSVLSVPVVLVVMPQPSDTLTLRLAVADSRDDAREGSTGSVKLGEASLAVGRTNLVAFRFEGVPIPRGAVIGSAVLGLTATKRSTLTRSLTLRYLGEAADDSPPLTDARRDLTARAKTTASILDSPAEWVMEQPNASPDLAAVIREIVTRPGWEPGNALTVFVDDEGSGSTRTSGSREGGAAQAAILTIHYWNP